MTSVPFSWNPFFDLQQLFEFSFMRHAYLAGTAAAIAAGAVGYFVVMRRLSFAAHSISNIGFAGATGGLALGIPPIAGLLAINFLGALVVGVLGKREHGRDVVIGVVLTTALGLGLLFLRLSNAQELVPVLVGDVLGISSWDVWVTVAASAAIVAAVAAWYRRLLFWSIDEEVAEARGLNVTWLSVLMLLVIAVVASVTTPIIGVLLTFTLMVGPAATATLLTPRPGLAVILAVVIGTLYMWVGLAISYWIDFPPSVFITTMAFVVYVIARLRPRVTAATAAHAAAE